MKKTLIAMTVAWIALTAKAADQLTLSVSNPLTQARVEVVEVDVSAIQKKLQTQTDIIVTDADGKEIPSQLTWDGKLIFQAGVGAKGKSVYYVKKGTPQPYEVRAKGRLFTERQDEFGWENDRVAYRVYGHGGAVGYDLFNKSTSDLMLDYWYASEQNQEMRSVSKQLHDRGYHDLADQVYNAFCYHIDHGKGMDCYTVGPTLGGGANALLNADGTLFMPKCYKTFEILDQGPLRFTVKFTYPEQEFNGEKVTEQRTISLDAGSQFNRVSITYQGLTKSAKMAAGTVIHKSNPTAYVLSQESGYLGYEDLGDASVYNAKYKDELAKQMGKIYIGLLFPQKDITMTYQQRENGIATGHILAISPYPIPNGKNRPAHGLDYYFGSGWDKNASTGFRSLTDWEAFLSDAAKGVRNPLKVTVK
ncbi:MAG: DUF4861 domain-containing protein [Bacteroidaceae bacterium]|nr:DUF4861 domain-containing protein [Bacteroidaceae bacterium]